MDDTSCPEQLKGQRVLVVEDDYFLAEDLRQAFVDCGAEVLGPYPDMFSALVRLAIDARPDLAVLDVKLCGETVFPLADVLRSIEIPIIFATAYARAEMPPEYQGELHVEKPMLMSAILQAFGP